MLEKGVNHNPNTGKFEVEYAFIDEPTKLSNNLGQVISIAQSEEKKLVREGLEEFNQKFEEMVQLGILSEVTQREMDVWDGPVHYVSIQHLGQGSKSLE